MRKTSILNINVFQFWWENKCSFVFCSVTSILPGSGGWEPFGVDCHSVGIARPLFCPIWVCLSFKVSRWSRWGETSLIRDTGLLSGLLLIEVGCLILAFLHRLLMQLSRKSAFVVGNCHGRHSSYLHVFLAFFGLALVLDLEVLLEWAMCGVNWKAFMLAASL